MDIRNRTCIPTDIIKPVLQAAARFTKSQTTDLLVKINPGKSLHGTAYDYSHANSNGKMINLIVPISRIHGIEDYIQYSSTLAFAERFYALAVHEFQHIADYQNNVPDMFGGSRADLLSSEERARSAAMLAVTCLYGEKFAWLEAFAFAAAHHQSHIMGNLQPIETLIKCQG